MVYVVKLKYRPFQNSKMYSKTVFTFYFVLAFILACTPSGQAEKWSQWSKCSVSCGQGQQTRFREKEVERKNCYQQFCPSYLGWPRIHFSGKIVVDASTLNNIVCNHNNTHFTSVQISEFPQVELSKKDEKFVVYKTEQFNWNPMGTGHVYFQDTKLTAMCTKWGVCDDSTSVTEFVLREVERAQTTTLDPDIQTNSEIWGLSIHIPGVLKAKYRHATDQQAGQRFQPGYHPHKGYAYMNAARFKSVLQNITWSSPYHEKIFNYAKELTMVMVLDYYNQISKKARVTGTIGLTSNDDPYEITSTRAMMSVKYGTRAPLFYYPDLKVAVVDLSANLPAYFNQTFKTNNLYLAMKVNCRFLYAYEHDICANAVLATSGETFYILKGLSNRYLDKNNAWYEKRGGVIDVSLQHLPPSANKLLSNHRLGILKATPTENYTYYKVLMIERPYGISFGIFNSVAMRLNVGQTGTYTTFASKFGKPLRGISLGVKPVITSRDMECWTSSGCAKFSSEPKEALRITSDSYFTGSSGITKHTFTAMSDPGDIRCGVDGQLYRITTYLKYKALDQTIMFFNPLLTKTNAKSVIVDQTQVPQVRIYNEVDVPECPGWTDVKEIFEQYYNLYPIMWRSGIVNLHSYEDVRRRAKLLKTAMFKLDYDDPKYMPASRDLSLSKQKLIWNWLKCGTKFHTRNDTKEHCSAKAVESGIEDLRALLQKAVVLELSTIPPYFTAWLSLKSEHGRNFEVENLLKTVFVEEMLHMSLAANVLNSIGGTVNLTNLNELPLYPKAIGSGAFYDIGHNVLLSLERFSLPLVRDVFLKVEAPSTIQERKTLHKVAKIWKFLLTKHNLAPSEKEQDMMEDLGVGDDDADEFRKFDFSDENLSLQSWNAVHKFSFEHLHPKTTKITSTIGGFYAQILMHLIYFESCAQLQGVNRPAGTIFTGKFAHQLNMSTWYNPPESNTLNATVSSVASQTQHENLSLSSTRLSFYVKQPSAPSSNVEQSLFPVFDLRTAIQAVLEIVYQGEGGSPCSIFRNEYGSSDYAHLSHYLRFMEIVHGRKLKLVRLSDYDAAAECLNSSLFNCPKHPKPGEAFCFVGKEIPFDRDGVWPIIANPSKFSYKDGSDAKNYDDQFRLQYTRTLWCLQRAFGGHPSSMKSCMAGMYDLTIIGKQLVSTPVDRISSQFVNMRTDCAKCHATPSWTFERDVNYRAGLYLDVQTFSPYN